MAYLPHTNKLLKLLKEHGRVRHYDKGEMIQSTEASQYVCVIKRGYVKNFQIANDGSIRILILYGPTDVFPLSLTYKVLLGQDLYSSPEVHYYEAMCRSEIILVDKDEFARLVKEDVLLYRELYAAAGHNLYVSVKELENIGLSNAYQRVAHLLAYYARDYGQRTLQGTRILVPVTQQDIADILSLTRETVSSNINQLRAAGLLRKHSRALIVKDLKKLLEVAYN